MAARVVPGIAGAYEELRKALLFVLISLFSVPGFTCAESSVPPSLAPRAVPVSPALHLPANALLFRRSQRQCSSYVVPRRMAVSDGPPAQSPFSTSDTPHSLSPFPEPSRKGGNFPPESGAVARAPVQPGQGVIPAGLVQPPLAANCCKPDMVLKRGTHGCHCVYPLKLDLLLLNISESPNWNMFLDEFASQLGLKASQIQLINFYMLNPSRMNISMDVLPHSGISFSASQASAINSSLVNHEIHFSPLLVGDYKLLNLTLFEPPPPSPAPQSSSAPIKAPAQGSSAAIPTHASQKEKHSNLIVIFGIAIGVLIIGVIFVIICSCLRREGKYMAPPPETAKLTNRNAASLGGSLTRPFGGSLPHTANTRFLSYEELKEATNDFESASILGEGGFGRVFKGVLSDGTAVAIKKLCRGGQQGNKEFQVEVEMLSRLHHRNLVKLVGYSSNHEASQHLLCYELVPNGSLEAWLHGPLGVNCPLDWETRMQIGLDAARGLAYLHEDSQPCVIHRDFKASNILLENNFHAKVSDFGLAKQAPEGVANFLSTRVMGTFGYVAPEYAMTGHLLVKSDVYSYGVVLLELLTGRKPVDMSQPSGEENLVTWARPILRDKERLEELADPRLGGKYPKEDFLRVCTVAAACVAPEAGQRPTMGEVVQSLKMVQRVAEYQDAAPASNARTNQRQSSTTFESDGTSSIFSSGPYSGLSTFENENIQRTAMFSEDLHEGR